MSSTAIPTPPLASPSLTLPPARWARVFLWPPAWPVPPVWTTPTKKIFCIIGDGESREGQIWEAVDFIVDHKLTAVRMVFNCNGQAQSDYVSPQQSADTLTEKLTAFGCEVKVIDGHNWDQVFEALTAEATDKPIAVVAKTVKGWGSKELASKNYHGKPLSEDQIAQAMADFDEIASQLGLDDPESVDAIQLVTPEPFAQPDSSPVSAGSFEQACAAVGLEKPFAEKKTRHPKSLRCRTGQPG